MTGLLTGGNMRGKMVIDAKSSAKYAASHDLVLALKWKTAGIIFNRWVSDRRSLRSFVLWIYFRLPVCCFPPKACYAKFRERSSNISSPAYYSTAFVPSASVVDFTRPYHRWHAGLCLVEGLSSLNTKFPKPQEMPGLKGWGAASLVFVWISLLLISWLCSHL